MGPWRSRKLQAPTVSPGDHLESDRPAMERRLGSRFGSGAFRARSSSGIARLSHRAGAVTHLGYRGPPGGTRAGGLAPMTSARKALAVGVRRAGGAITTAYDHLEAGSAIGT